MIRDKILEEYRAEGFECSTKASQYDDGKTFYPIVELEKFFYADNPGGQIVCEIHTMNNSYAVVTATLIGTDNKIWKANGYYAHSNTDSWGVNYLGTAQANALRAVLNIWFAQKGDTEGANVPFNFAPENSAPTDDIPLSPPMSLPDNHGGMTTEQAMKTSLGQPFNGRTIEQIVSFGNPDELIALKNRLQMELQISSNLAPVAKVILPLISTGGAD